MGQADTVSSEWRFFAYRIIRADSEPFDPGHPAPTEHKLKDDYLNMLGFSGVRLDKTGPDGNILPENQRAVYVRS